MRLRILHVALDLVGVEPLEASSQRPGSLFPGHRAQCGARLRVLIDNRSKSYALILGSLQFRLQGLELAQERLDSFLKYRLQRYLVALQALEQCVDTPASDGQLASRLLGIR